MYKKELDWISQHQKKVEKFAGKWIAVLSDKVLATGDSVKSVMKEIKRKQVKRLPLVTKVPRKDEEMYIL